VRLNEQHDQDTVEIAFDHCTIQPAKRTVLIDGRPAAIGGRAFDLLLALIKRRDRLVICDTNGSSSAGNSTNVDTPLVPLSPQGDAAFHGNIGPLPSACSQPDIAFLIVNPNTGRWIAYGAIRTP
jgi:hypothetical protein